jgi:3',5'-cyclic AMP phosphodiesterase CpdA
MPLCSSVMRFAHLSDLHFGQNVCPEKLRSLVDDLIAQRPDLLVLTGDVTDRGKVSEFRRAAKFLDAMGVPFISVPGNREIGVSAFREWMFPKFAMARYRKFIGPSDRILHRCEDSRVLFLGVNSVHSFPAWPGTISRQTRYWLKQQASESAGYVKILFLHHPVLPVIRSSSYWAHTLSDAGEILNICSDTRIALILQGHKHRSSVAKIRFPEKDAGIVVCAGGAPLMPWWDAAYHMIGLSETELTVETREFSDGGFRQKGVFSFAINKDV